MKNTYIILVERFVAVAQEGSIQAAARKLNLSQPSLTQSVKRIEEIFECKLLERSKRGVILTLTGEVLLRRSLAILEANALAKVEISDLVAGRTGSIHIAAGMVWGTQYLPPIIHQLQAKFPDLKIELDISITNIGLKKLHRGDVDLVVGGVFGEIEEVDGFSQEALISQRYAVGCSRDSELATATNVSISQVATHPMVLYQEDELLFTSVLDQIEVSKGVTFDLAIKTSSILVAVEMAIEGPYVLFAAAPLLERFRASGLSIVDLDEELNEFQTAMFYRNSLRQTEPFQALLCSLRSVSSNAKQGLIRRI